MDSTDQRLLSLLRDNARLSVAALAKSLQVARGTVQNRLARMARDGTIVGYTVKLKPAARAVNVPGLLDSLTMVASSMRGDALLCSERRAAPRCMSPERTKPLRKLLRL